MLMGSYTPAAALAVFGVTCVVIGDTAAKVLVEGGFAPIFVAWTRFAIAALVIVPLCGITRAESAHFLDWRLILRGLFVVVGISCILTALRTEEIANVFGAFFIGPIVAFVLGAILLREAVTALRVVLLAIGFVGVLLVVKPGFGMTAGLALAVLAGVSYGAYLVSTRWLSGTARPRLLLSTQLVVGGVVLAPFGLTALPVEWSPGIVGLLAVSVFGSAIGNYGLAVVSRVLPAGILAPLVYSQLISATALGFWVFGDWPDTLSLLGLLLILISGFGTLLAVQRRG